jgi:hypothetical protein
MIVVISCSRRKAHDPLPAIELYRGNHFGMRREIARLMTTDDNIYIISALHGLLRAKQIVARYDQPMDETSSLTKETIREQAKRLRISNYPVAFIGSEKYLELIEGVFPSVLNIMPPGLPMLDRQEFMQQLMERLANNVSN